MKSKDEFIDFATDLLTKFFDDFDGQVNGELGFVNGDEGYLSSVVVSFIFGENCEIELKVADE